MTIEDRGVATRTAEDWRVFAACADGDPETAAKFFCVGASWDNPRDKVRAAEAKAICAGCLVRTECLSWALATGQPYAIAGGLTDDERRALGGATPVQRTAPPCGSEYAYQQHRRAGEHCAVCRNAYNVARRARRARLREASA